jgi:hypothetical protein
VREVSLLGTADLAFWKDRLRAEGLFPAEGDGKAQLLVSSVDSRYLGIPFRELTVSVFVSRQAGGAGGDGAYLAHAFNSSRLFAFLERTCFSTPYYPAKVDIRARLPIRLRLTQGREGVFRAEMSAGSRAAPREPSRSGDDGWEGPIFLPGSGRRAPGKVFFARLSGHTETYPFSPGDVLALDPSPKSQILRALVESRFAVREWVIRADATHARSKTFARGAAPGF